MNVALLKSTVPPPNVALTVLAVAVLLWPVLAVWYVSPGHPDSVCTSGGTPLGWPTWLPV
ncbi:hypothetical protein ACFU6I_47440 [Streptomyces sp. NPDC057486]|uniref:hypothetical protein n=1 Tax=Streptomyces sp. NPDC057486 TaxID=3346145 RepID=UPI0036A01E9C